MPPYLSFLDLNNRLHLDGRFFGFDGGTPSPLGINTRYGYEFDGVDENLNFGDILDNNGSQAFSISGWFKSLSNSNEIIFSKLQSSNYGLKLRLFFGGIRFYIGTNYSSDGLEIGTANGLFNNNEWYNFSIVYNGSKASDSLTIYVNGVQQTSVIYSSGFTGDPSNNNDFILGSDNTSLFYEGRLDDVQFFDYELTSANALDIYNSGYVKAPSLAPVHHWKLGEDDYFSGGAWTVTDSVGSLNGVSVNMEEVSRRMGVSYSFGFDGVDESINFGDILDKNGGSSFSVSFWLKYESFAFDYLIGKRGPGGGYLITQFNQNIRVYLKDENGLQTIFGGSNMALGNWYNVVITYDGVKNGSSSKVYMNGVSSSVVYSSSFLGSCSNSDNFVLGSDSLGANFFNGKLMELSFFDTELSAAEAQNLYNNGVPIDPRNISLSPTFYAPLGWKNDSFSGGVWTVTDEIKGNNGQSVNMDEFNKTSATP